MPQTSVSTQQPVALAGQISDLAPHTIRSYVNAEASASIGVGVMVCEGSAVNEVVNLATGKDAGDMVGISVHQHAALEDVEVDEDGFKPDATLGVLTHGTIWVQAEEAVTKDDPVYVRVTATGDEVFGAFRDDTDSGDGVNVSAFCRFLDYDSGTGLALLEVNMSGRGADLVD